MIGTALNRFRLNESPKALYSLGYLAECYEHVGALDDDGFADIGVAAIIEFQERLVVSIALLAPIDDSASLVDFP